jgi:hypothetical protein
LMKTWGTRLAMLAIFSTSCLRIISTRWCRNAIGHLHLGWNN